REVLESTAAGLAAKHASEPEIYALREMISKQQDCLDDAEAQAHHNRLFHNALYHASHNRYLLKTLNSLKDAMVLLGATTYKVPGRSETALEEHRAIVDAIEKGDRTAAEDITREHIRAAQKARIELINQG
ncbi:MAG: FCD domain-containing protein, partial [Motiliproteus sp.]|nr:FCD domain-containing protein [Motiliproteus sp.]